MRLLVTGGAGFIGSNFIRYWLKRHALDDVVNVDLLTYAGDPSSLLDVEAAYPSRYRLVRSDIADATTMIEIMERSQPNIVVNFAAESHNSRAVLDPAAFVRTNVLGTQTLLEAARRTGVERIHHISTCEVYGDMSLDEPKAFSEEAPHRPRTPYNASKAAADLVVRAYQHTFGTPATISISCNNYGPWQHPEKMIPLFITNALAGRPLPVYQSSVNRREWIHVEDHCRAIEAVLTKGRIGETYNVGTGYECSVDKVADEILAILDKPNSLKSYVQDRPGHDRRYLLDSSKIANETGWRPTVDFDEGLRITAGWYAENVRWWRQKKDASPDESAWIAKPSVGTLTAVTP